MQRYCRVFEAAASVNRRPLVCLSNLHRPELLPAQNWGHYQKNDRKLKQLAQKRFITDCVSGQGTVIGRVRPFVSILALEPTEL